MRELTARGDFWLPEAADQKVSGLLEYRPGDGAKLSLIGELPDAPRTPGRIIGHCSNKYMTLDNCFQTYHRRGLGGSAEQEFRVGKIFEGAAYSKDEETAFDQLSVELRHFFDWVGRNGLEETYEVTAKQGTSEAPPKWAISVTKLNDLKAQVNDQVEVTVYHGMGITGDTDSRTLTQSASIHFQFDSPHPLEEVSAYASVVQDLVSIATDRVAEFDSFKLSHPDLEMKLPSGTPYRQYVDFHVEWRARESSAKDLNSFSAPFDFEAIGGLEGIAEWIRQTADLQPMLNRVMSTRYAESMYSDDRFFNRCAALEGLHRLMKGTTTTKFGRRLDDLAAWAGPPFERLVADLAAWRDMVRNERDDHAHHLSNALEATGASRYYLADSAYWLFVFCLLRRCNYPEAVFASVEKSASFEWLRERLAELITP
jgi:hypothetical protein